MHPREIIRHRVFDILDDSPGFKLVQIGRRHKLNEKRSIPAAIIYTDHEEQELVSSAPITFRHTLELKVVFYVKSKGSDRGESALDYLCEGAESLIMGAFSEQDFIKRAVPTEWEIEADGEANAEFLEGTRTFQIIYDSILED